MIDQPKLINELDFIARVSSTMVDSWRLGNAGSHARFAINRLDNCAQGFSCNFKIFS